MIEVCWTALKGITVAHGAVILAAVALPVPCLVLAVAGSHKHTAPPAFPELKPHALGPVLRLDLALQLFIHRSHHEGCRGEQQEKKLELNHLDGLRCDKDEVGEKSILPPPTSWSCKQLRYAHSTRSADSANIALKEYTMEFVKSLFRGKKSAGPTSDGDFQVYYICNECYEEIKVGVCFKLVLF